MMAITDTSMDLEFNDIRPYRDYELQEKLQQMANSDGFDMGMQFMMGKYISFYRQDHAGAPDMDLKEWFKNISTVKQFQQEIVIDLMLRPMIRHTMDGLTCSGLNRLSPDEAYLYISNHRDITLDPAVLNFNLNENGFDTVEIAFGDNLLLSDFISDLIRVNKSFIVKRNLSIMEQLKAAKQLSKYIFYTLNRKQSVWIAQREGRAKDGNDMTNPAIISMLYLGQKDNMSFSEYVSKIKIVPISISYEFDPCDRMKGLELYNTQVKGQHKKGANEDLTSMNQGIAGYKGRVHYSFGTPLSSDFTNDKEMAAAIDQAIHLNYKLWPNNYIAFDQVNQTSQYNSFYTEEDTLKFLDRYKRLSPEISTIIMKAYAQPLINQEKQKHQQ